MAKLEEYIVKGGKQLRLGYTTGSCAAAASKAAAVMLLTGNRLTCVRLATPKGIPLLLELEEVSLTAQSAVCAVRKDAGDDPDITNGLLVYAKVSRQPQGIDIQGGEGIGIVTRQGLACPVGDAAINPGPLKQIRRALREVCQERRYEEGLKITIWAPGGGELAKRTFNPRLGIAGGISILGTTGIVEPMSERALVDTIRAELDSRRAAGQKNLLLAPGNYGAGFIRQELGLSLEHAVLCSNYIGETLDYAAYLGFQRIVLVGHGGKLVKAAGGVMQTHSSQADCRMEILAAYAGVSGADSHQQRKLLGCVTVDEANGYLREWGIWQKTWDEIGQRIGFHLNTRAGGNTKVYHIVYTLLDGILTMSEGVEEMLDAWKEKQP